MGYHWRGSNMGAPGLLDEKYVGGLYPIVFIECQTVSEVDEQNSFLRNSTSWIIHQRLCVSAGLREAFAVQ